MLFWFQVISGGNYDVDVALFDESGKTLYTVQKKQYDSYSFTTQAGGVYKFCFSNEFSTFSHKVVYFDFQAGGEPPLTDEMGAHHTALTQMETSCVTIHQDLKVCLTLFNLFTPYFTGEGWISATFKGRTFMHLQEIKLIRVCLNLLCYQSPDYVNGWIYNTMAQSCKQI